jgi:F-type H+-transporting ATPase subunit delta
VIKDVCEKLEIQKLVVDFLQCLFDRERLDSIGNIIKVFKDHSDRLLGRVDVLVKCAVDLNKTEQKNLSGELKALLGKEVNVEFITDPELLGGFVVKASNSIYDYSIKGHLEHLEEKILKMRIK